MLPMQTQPAFNWSPLSAYTLPSAAACIRESLFLSGSRHCLQVEVLEDQSTGKRTIRTTSMCWGNKLSLLARPALFDPRLQANPQQPDLDFSQAVLEISDDEAWQKVRAHACNWHWCSLCP